MKILLLGHNGYLGSYLYKNLYVDILNDRKIYDNGTKYDYIINCIGKPSLEYCEINEIETNYANYGILEDIKTYYPSSKIINFSSYYVYNCEGFCHESSNTTKKYNYSKQKLKSESLVENGVTFRLGKLFGHQDLNKQNKLTEYIIKNNDIMLDTVKFNPTSLNQVLNIINYELKNNTLYGIYNLSNDGFCSHYEYGSYIGKLLGDTKKINKIENIGKNFDNYGKFLMSCEKIKKYTVLTPWQLDLELYLKSL